MRILAIAASAATLLASQAASADEPEAGALVNGECPVTLGTDELLGPDSHYSYGSEALAVALPADGTWPVTGPTALIAVKLFWRSAGFRPGMEHNLHVEIKSLHDGPNDAVVTGVTNANSPRDDIEAARFDDEWQDGWVMLTGIDFPSAGCWQITGEYLGQSLTFVVQTVQR